MGIWLFVIQVNLDICVERVKGVGVCDNALDDVMDGIIESKGIQVWKGNVGFA